MIVVFPRADLSFVSPFIRHGSILLAVFLMVVGFSFAQSGRASKSSEKSPNDAGVTKPKSSNDEKNADLNSTKASDLTLETYRLVFPVLVDGQDNSKITDAEAERIRRANTDSFVKRLNEVGSVGYRLISIVNGWNPVGLVKLDEGQYEYAWFETHSIRQAEKPDFEEKYARFADKGFHLTFQVRYYNLCDPTIDDNFVVSGEDCRSDDLFLVEREKQSKLSREYYFLHESGLRMPGSKASEELSAEANRKLKEGFLPTYVISQLEILFEKTSENTNISAGAQIQIVRSPGGRNQLTKRVNKFAKEGYRLAMINNGVALMYKTNENTATSYVWLDTARRDMMLRLKRKRYETEFARLIRSGAIFRMMYPNKQGDVSTLVLEQQLQNSKATREYKIFTFDFDIAKDSSGKLQRTLTQQSHQTFRMINELVRSGFVPRSLFYSDRVSVILEKQ